MGLLEGRDYYKPFEYPAMFSFYQKQQKMHWSPEEIPMAEDIKDWNRRLTEVERGLLTQLFRFFTQADSDIAQGYVERYLPRFPHPEVRMMLLSFASMEAVHQHAYSLLIDTLGIPESEYKAFQAYKEMREKHEFMFEHPITKNITDLIVDIATFSAFGEGLQLFSSFAVLLSFQRRGLLKGASTVTEWSIRDESLHVEGMISLFHVLVNEHRRAWNDETKRRIYDTCRKMVDLEDAFIDLMFGMGDIEGINKESTKSYIRYIADRRLLQLGLKPNYGVKENPFSWLDEIMNLPVHTNFFEARSTEYGKGGVQGWDTAFNFLNKPRDSFLTSLDA
jgi:ribonucleoside-diphosphate reductase beta chain